MRRKFEPLDEDAAFETVTTQKFNTDGLRDHPTVLRRHLVRRLSLSPAQSSRSLCWLGASSVQALRSACTHAQPTRPALLRADFDENDNGFFEAHEFEALVVSLRKQQARIEAG